MKSGPDVFADALVPGTSLFPERSRSRNASFPGTPAFAGALRWPARQASGAEIFPRLILIVRRCRLFRSACYCRRVIVREFGIRVAGAARRSIIRWNRSLRGVLRRPGDE